MGKMTPHEFLINIIVSTVLNIVPYPSAPIAPSGTLSEDFGYKIRLPKFGDTIKNLMKKRGAKVPDLMLECEREKLLIIVECKTNFTFEVEEKLKKQVDFYSSNEFRDIWKGIFTDLNKVEIWLCSPKGFSEKMVSFAEIQSKKENVANLVVLEVRHMKAEEQAHIRRVYGILQDGKLNDHMKEGKIICSLPRTELLVDPTLSYGERVFRIGRRILSLLAVSYLTEKERRVTLEDFRKRYPDIDAMMTDRELKRCIRYLWKLVPQIGKYNSSRGEIILARRPSLDRIKASLERIQGLTEEEIKTELAKAGKKGRLTVPKRPKTVQKTKLERWLPRGASSASIWIGDSVTDFTDITAYAVTETTLADMYQGLMSL